MLKILATLIAATFLVSCAGRAYVYREPVYVDRVVYVDQDYEHEHAFDPYEYAVHAGAHPNRGPSFAAEYWPAEPVGIDAHVDLDVQSPALYAPTPAKVVIVQDLPRSQRAHTKWHYDRAVERCDRRATKWARNRCYGKVARGAVTLIR